MHCFFHAEFEGEPDELYRRKESLSRSQPVWWQGQYTIIAAAKSICTGSGQITDADLTNPEIVGIEAFTLIIHALLIVRYGLDALKITAKKLTHRFSPDGSAFSWKDQLALAA